MLLYPFVSKFVFGLGMSDHSSGVMIAEMVFCK